jgi:choline dehydrogenase-like flavoprotein
MRTVRTQVLVIGSGAGGSLTAARLAEGGRDVVVVEEGHWIDQSEIEQYSLEQMQRQYRNDGLTVALGRPSVSYVEASCVGGGTEVNSGLYHRPPEALLHRWRKKFAIRDFLPGDLLPHSDLVEQELGISRSPGDVPTSSELLAQGARHAGWSCAEVPRWYQYPAGSTSTSDGVKQSMTRSYLPRAIAAGALVLADTRVSRFKADQGIAYAATSTSAGNEQVEIFFEDVFVCGGAIHTPALLQRSGFRHQIGKTLGLHPTVKALASFDTTIDAQEVPVHQVLEFANELTFGGSASRPGMQALALADNWADFRHAMERPEQNAVYYGAIRPQGRGQVRTIPGLRDPLVMFRLTHQDNQLLQSGLTRLCHLLLSAGANAVYPSMRNAPVVRSSSDIERLADRFAARNCSLMTVHLSASVPLGGRPDLCATNSYGRLRGASNVYVNDASLLPEPPGMNPQGTLMAIVSRNSTHYLEASRAG